MVDIPHSATETAEPSHGSSVRERRDAAVRAVVDQGVLSDDQPLCATFCLDTADELIDSLKTAYPDRVNALHTVAAKAIAVPSLLRQFAEAGLGCEVASPGELSLAMLAGFSSERIIYDSPAKTISEIRRALELGVSFNIDNFEELERVDRLVDTWTGALPPIGIRINPQSGAGSIEAMSTATATSKFGIGLVDYRESLVRMCVDRPWITQLHVHSGSQGLPLRHTAADVSAIVALAEDIEAVVGRQQITRIDVGGGLSVNFQSDEITPRFTDHATALINAVPRLFSGKYRLMTEFGRSLTAKAGNLIGRVEYLKQAGTRRIAVTHIGVQVAARTVFMPESWPLRIELYSAEGKPRSENFAEYDIAGPACFAGDLIASQRLLPRIESGDLVVVPDTGGYYASNHFSYNSLARPAIYATRLRGSFSTLQLARSAQTLEQIMSESGEVFLTDLALRES